MFVSVYEWLGGIDLDEYTPVERFRGNRQPWENIYHYTSSENQLMWRKPPNL